MLYLEHEREEAEEQVQDALEYGGTKMQTLAFGQHTVSFGYAHYGKQGINRLAECFNRFPTDWTVNPRARLPGKVVFFSHESSVG
jgi:hypothetical protein